MIERLKRTRRNQVLLVLAVLAAWFCWTVRSVLNPLIVGYLAAYILMPLVQALERRGHSRRAAVNWIFASGFVLAMVVAFGLLAQLRTLAVDVYTNARDVPLHQALQGRVDEFVQTLNGWGLHVRPLEVPDLEGLRAQVRRFLDESGGVTGETGVALARKGMGILGRFLGGVFSAAGLFFLVPLYCYYFLFVIGDVHASIRHYLPVRDRERLSRVAERIGEVVSSFFRGRLSVALLKGLFLGVSLVVLGMPYGFLLGMLSGFLSIIPFVGAFGGFVLAVLVGILEHGVIGSAWRASVVFGVGEVIEGYVLVPKILGDRLGLHELVVFAALLAGGAALGMLGLLIALPLTAALVILFQEFVKPALEQLAEEPDEAGAGP